MGFANQINKKCKRIKCLVFRYIAPVAAKVECDEAQHTHTHTHTHTHRLRQTHEDLPLSLCLYTVGGLRTGMGTIPPQEAA